MKYLLITGSFRSGTSMLAQILNEHSQVVIANESFFFYDKKELDIKLQMAIENKIESGEVGPGWLLEKMPKYKEFIEVCKQNMPLNHEQFMNLHIKYSEKRPIYYGDKLPEYVFHLKKIVKKWRPKIIFCLRDPRDVTLSQLKNYKKLMEKYGRIGNHWWAKPNIDAVFKDKNWYDYVSTWDKLKRKLKIEYYEFRYETFLTKTELVVEEIAQFLGIRKDELSEIATKIVNRDNLFSNKDLWIDIDSRLPKKWLKMMAKYGYE
jgi:hypothetical protein